MAESTNAAEESNYPNPEETPEGAGTPEGGEQEPGEETPEGTPEGEPEGEPEEPAEQVEIDGKSYEKGSDEYHQALEKVHRDYQNLLPEYTKKAQRLAELEPGSPDKDLPRFLQKGWRPRTWEDLQNAFAEAADYGSKKAQEVSQKERQALQDAQSQVDTYVKSISKTYPDFNEQDFFSYVERHKLRVDTMEDLKSAFSVYADKNALAPTKGGKPQKKGASAPPSAPSSTQLPYDPTSLRGGGSIGDKARQALRAFTK